MADHYRPSNGTEGEYFYATWCRHCQRDAEHRADPINADGCEILLRSYALDITDPEYPSEWTYRDGEPVCTAFVREGCSHG